MSVRCFADWRRYFTWVYWRIVVWRWLTGKPAINVVATFEIEMTEEEMVKLGELSSDWCMNCFLALSLCKCEVPRPAPKKEETAFAEYHRRIGEILVEPHITPKQISKRIEALHAEMERRVATLQVK